MQTLTIQGGATAWLQVLHSTSGLAWRTCHEPNIGGSSDGEVIFGTGCGFVHFRRHGAAALRSHRDSKNQVGFRAQDVQGQESDGRECAALGLFLEPNGRSLASWAL